MAQPPITEDELVARYGPHLNQAPAGGWNAGLEIDREVQIPNCSITRFVMKGDVFELERFADPCAVERVDADVTHEDSA